MKTIKIILLPLAVMLLVLCSRACGAEDFKAPEVDGKADFWMSLGIAALALAGICVVAFKSTRRTHLD